VTRGRGRRQRQGRAGKDKAAAEQARRCASARSAGGAAAARSAGCAAPAAAPHSICSDSSSMTGSSAQILLLMHLPQADAELTHARSFAVSLEKQPTKTCRCRAARALHAPAAAHSPKSADSVQLSASLVMLTDRMRAARRPDRSRVRAGRHLAVRELFAIQHECEPRPGAVHASASLLGAHLLVSTLRAQLHIGPPAEAQEGLVQAARGGAVRTRPALVLSAQPLHVPPSLKLQSLPARLR
jgi:hypothetical protein